VGVCKGGTQTCKPDGSGWEDCAGAVLPAAETCLTPEDDDCDGQVNEEGAGCVCVPGSTAPCYSGPMGTEGVGACKAGTKVCNADGLDYGACTGEVVPAAETCLTPEDDDCDGQVNEEGAGCVCVPGSTAPCYSGPMGTADVGACKAGQQTCNADGLGYGACVGEVVPVPETCATPVDDDCDGQVNEEGASCVCVPGTTQACYTGPMGTAGVGLCKAGAQLCNDQGTAWGACTGQVLPAAEACAGNTDDDCDGKINNGCVYASCLDAHQKNPAAPSGTYTVDFDGPGFLPPVTVTCDMTTDGGGWTRFWWVLADYGAVSVDPLGQDLWTCDPAGNKCFGRIPSGVTPADFMVKDVDEKFFGAWHFNAANGTSNAVLSAMRDHNLACVVNGAQWMPYLTNDNSGEAWCGVGGEGGCDSFHYQLNGSCVSYKNVGWAMELDGDGGCYAAAFKMGAGQSGYYPQCQDPDNNFLDDGPSDTDDKHGELYFR
jgi:hypothetical protein